VSVRILEPRAEAGRIPVARTTELGLEASGCDRDHGARAVGDPVTLVVVVELDGRVRGQDERAVGAVLLCVEAVVLGPGVVQRGLVLVAPGREREAPLPDVVAGVVGEMRR